MIAPSSSGDASFVVHKRYGFTREPVLQKMKGLMPPGMWLNVNDANIEPVQLFKRLKKAGGDVKLINIYRSTPLAIPQIRYLKETCRSEVYQLSTQQYAIRYRGDKNKDLIFKALNKFDEIQNSSATCLQSIFRGNRSRKAVTEYREAKHAFELASAKLSKLSK